MLPLSKLLYVAGTRTFLFSLTIVALLAAKLLHVFSHFRSTALPLFILYFPTYFTPDVLVIFTSRLLYQRSLVFSVLFCLLITLAASAQISLFVETGGELRWSMLSKMSREPQGFVGMLMTGLMSTSLTTCALACVAFFLTPTLYNAVQSLTCSFLTTITPTRWRRSRSRGAYNLLNNDTEAQDEDSGSPPRPRSVWWPRVKLAVLVGIVSILHLVRPHSPFAHMTGTLPFTMFEGIFSRRSPMCDPSPFDGPNRFPYPKMISEEHWTAPREGFQRGWRPGSPWWEIRRERPSWLPEEKIAGFAKWYRGSSFDTPYHEQRSELPKDTSPPEAFHSETPPPGYEPVLDPLKLSNIDKPYLDELDEALRDKAGKSTVDIRHVFILTLESTRKDIFPLVKGSLLWEELEGSWSKSKRSSDYDRADLSQLSVNAELVTGQDSGFDREVNRTHGGLNVLGAMTSSTSTVKSMLASHCGVNPLPVDFLEEIETEIYQPCLPQILHLMNANKKSDLADGSQPWREGRWKSVSMQAGTGAIDRQTQLFELSGFDRTIDREYLRSPDAEFPIAGSEIGYLGFSEQELKPYIRKAITEAEENGERLLLSHITTSTHHPWAIPEDKKLENYWGDSRKGSTPWNRYLNTVKYSDRWIGEFFEIIQEMGIAEKTLIVVLGDHGFSFGDSSSSMKTTYSNPHISSFPIPMTFYHPNLPRASTEVTVTPVSVVPTILDLLVATDSLASGDREIARDLIPEYEGQSLIRQYVQSGDDNREAWSFSVVNPGGTHLAITSAAYPYRYVVPVCELSPFGFSDLRTDPLEKNIMTDWEGGKKFAAKISDVHGKEAGSWARRAQKISRWYVREMRSRYGYWSGARQEDRGVGHREDGAFKHEHWWDT